MHWCLELLHGCTGRVVFVHLYGWGEVCAFAQQSKKGPDPFALRPSARDLVEFKIILIFAKPGTTGRHISESVFRQSFYGNVEVFKPEDYENLFHSCIVHVVS